MEIWGDRRIQFNNSCDTVKRSRRTETSIIRKTNGNMGYQEHAIVYIATVDSRMTMQEYCTMFAWLLLLLSVVAHAMWYCATDECDSSGDDEPSTMYS